MAKKATTKTTAKTTQAKPVASPKDKALREWKLASKATEKSRLRLEKATQALAKF